MRTSRRASGFTLVEVMIALSILAAALVGLIGRTAANIRMTQEMGMLDVAVELARGKMYDVEDELLRDGFPELDKDEEGDFSDEGWPRITWRATITKIELPSLSALAGADGEAGAGGEAGGDKGGLGGIAGGALGGLGGGEGSDPGAGMLGAMSEMINQVLEVSIRKVTLEVMWTVGNEEKKTVVACYFTDPVAMNSVIGGLGMSGADGSSTGQPGGDGGGGRFGGGSRRGGDTK